ncbi:PelA/Pel-15E family pectate lyase [Sphingomonas naasensis]|uniref:Pectate lyase n=1 Tax=Sphingomonas naasensis TaxID=1344951 RepID=A0A4S1WPF1_9SPHN|nr:pectate lyase [Sphingomonas naasensis]NIJ20284.1 PelA/Pel-15E family pectate lyase [Sphingomonas naasensis]TGX44415.1 pectate lyase [Sphingomonas naasensis]
MMLRTTLILLGGFGLTVVAHAQTPAKHVTNVDEAKVGSYVLPEILKLADGRPVRDASTWTRDRRPEILRLFAANQFGVTPATDVRPRVEPVERDGIGLGGLARRTQVRLVVGDTKIRVVLYTPANAKGPVPVLLHIGFSPNVLVFNEPGIDEGMAWDGKTRTRVPDRQALNLAGFDARPFVGKGFAVAHVYYGDIEPDFAGGEKFGVRAALGGTHDPRKPDEWGAIGAWAWGLSRIVDWLQTEKAIDGGKIALSGASRLGKATLWAAAQDPRFTLAFPLISGESGASISRRDFGETVADIASPERYHYWFAPRYQSYGGDVGKLPVDGHMLLSLIAPRPMLLVNGDEDTWSDWHGEKVAADAARPVYDLFGAGDRLQIFTHKGGHKVLPEDLAAMADFMARQFGDPGVAAANAARKANPNRPIAWWPAMAVKPESWFAGDEARTIADNILSWQDPKAGGWPLMNTTLEPNRGDPAQAGPWGTRAALIKATVNEMRFLARAHAAKPDPRYPAAIDRGLGYILDAQYPGGGFPHSWPVFTNPYDHQATFNDDEIVDLMELLRDVATRPEFGILPTARRKAAQAGFDRGLDFILKTQIQANGERTAWAQQYDEKTLAPRGARAFEPVAISGGESAGVLLLLMSIERPGQEVRRAIEAGVAWYRKVQIDGLRVEVTADDRIARPDPSAPTIWARYYQIGTNRPIFVGRDGVIRYAMAEVEQERRAGYAWYGNGGSAVLARYAEWVKQHR